MSKSGINNPVVVPFSTVPSAEPQGGGLLAEFGEAIKGLKEEGYSVDREYIPMQEILQSQVKSELVEIAKYLNIETKSLKKSDLIHEIIHLLLNPVHLYQTLIAFDDEEMKLFRTVLHAGAYMPGLRENAFVPDLLQTCLVMRKDNALEVPVEVAEVFADIDTAEFEEKRRKVSWLLKCLDFACAFYGAFPIKILAKLFQKGKGMKVAQKELAALIEEGIAPQITQAGDLYMNESILKNNFYETILEEQGSIAYYIPTRKEIMDQFYYKYLPEEECLTAVREFLLEKNHLDIFEMEEILCCIQKNISYGAEITDVTAYLEEKGIPIPKSKKKKLTQLLDALRQNTRMLLYRGFTRSEAEK